MGRKISGRDRPSPDIKGSRKPVKFTIADPLSVIRRTASRAPRPLALEERARDLQWTLKTSRESPTRIQDQISRSWKRRRRCLSCSRFQYGSPTQCADVSWFRTNHRTARARFNLGNQLANGYLQSLHVVQSAADGKLAPPLQGALQRFAKPWYRLRTLRIFRDRTSLAVNPALWPAVEEALLESEHFLLLASPEAAASTWVQREVEFWCEHRSPETLFIILTDGDLIWHEGQGDFDWAQTTALPRNLKDTFSHEPLYVDLRWARTTEEVSRNHPQFLEVVAEVGAALHGRPKDELVGDDVRQHRRTRMIAWSATVCLIALTLAATWAAFIAMQRGELAEQRREEAVLAANSEVEARKEADSQRERAEEQRNVATAQMLAARAEALLSRTDDFDPLSILLAVESLKRYPSMNATQTLRSVTARAGEPVGVTRPRHSTPLNAIDLSPDGTQLALAGDDGFVRFLDVSSGNELHRLRHPGNLAGINAVAFSPDNRLLTISTMRSKFWRFTITEGQEVRHLETKSIVGATTLGPRGVYAAGTTTEDYTVVWDLAAAAEVVRLAHGASHLRSSFDPAGRFIAVATASRVNVWKLPSGVPVARITHGNTVEALVFDSL